MTSQNEIEFTDSELRACSKCEKKFRTDCPMDMTYTCYDCRGGTNAPWKNRKLVVECDL